MAVVFRDKPFDERVRTIHDLGFEVEIWDLSICTGAHLLALAGLLDGRPATTHWNHATEFSREFPAVRLDLDVLFVDDGDVLTSAGAAAGVDLC